LLSSMHLRIWRTDRVTSLLPHPNDPGPARSPIPRGMGRISHHAFDLHPARDSRPGGRQSQSR
jgi:hypothetical protein